MLNEIFDVGKFLADNDMVERYSEYFNKILINSQDWFVQHRHKIWKIQEGEDSQQLNFYERMKIDEIMRDRKTLTFENNLKDEPMSAINGTTRSVSSSSDSLSDSKPNNKEDKEKKKIKKLAKNMDMTFE